MVNHFRADAAVDEVFDGEETRGAVVGGAVAGADHGEICALVADYDDVVEIVVAVEILALILQTSIVVRLRVGVDFVV